MLNIAALLDRARIALAIKSDRQLSLALNLDGSAVSQFRSGRMMPAPETIFKLCQLVGDDPRPALADLGAMKSEGDVRRMPMTKTPADAAAADALRFFLALTTRPPFANR